MFSPTEPPVQRQMSTKLFTGPCILYAAPPREGHMRPALQICKHLTQNGFDVTILGTKRWQATIEAIGAHFSPIIGLWGTLDDPGRWPDIAYALDPASRLAASLEGGFVSLLPSGLESVRFALAGIRQRRQRQQQQQQQPAPQIIVLSDTCFSGTLALKLGADLPEGFGEGEDAEVKTIGIGVVPTFWSSPERPPWGSGLPFDDSEEGRHRNTRLLKKTYNKSTEERARWILSVMGCQKALESLYEDLPLPSTGTSAVRQPDDFQHPFWDAATICHNVTLQMCLPTLEFPSSDWPSSRIKFAGTLPIKPLPSHLVYPPWFHDEIICNSASLWASLSPLPSSSPPSCSKPDRKKIIFVAQGTEVLDHRELILPTIRALAGNPDVVVVACLCVAGATLDIGGLPDGRLPDNARVVDYFPYDAILAHADVFVSNSGYGGFQHAVSNGVPMVQAGNSFDKPDIGRRIEWSGLGVFLGESPIRPEALEQALMKVLATDAYRKRAEELKAEAASFDPLGKIEHEILALAAGRR